MCVCVCVFCKYDTCTPWLMWHSSSISDRHTIRSFSERTGIDAVLARSSNKRHDPSVLQVKGAVLREEEKKKCPFFTQTPSLRHLLAHPRTFFQNMNPRLKGTELPLSFFSLPPDCTVCLNASDAVRDDHIKLWNQCSTCSLSVRRKSAHTHTHFTSIFYSPHSHRCHVASFQL